MAGGPDLRSIVSKTNKIESYARDVQQWAEDRVAELEQTHGAPLPERLEHPHNLLEAQMEVTAEAMVLVRHVLEDPALTVEAAWLMVELLKTAAVTTAEDSIEGNGRFVDLETGRSYEADELRHVLADLV